MDVVGRILPAIALALVAQTGRKKVGIVSPIRGQMAAAKLHWEAQGLDPLMDFGDWSEDRAALEQTALRMQRSDVELVVLDCMGRKCSDGRIKIDQPM
eukprot:SAG31_NODE_2999_length_4800_cov_2.481387_4_plen_98_part_00